MKYHKRYSLSIIINNSSQYLDIVNSKYYIYNNNCTIQNETLYVYTSRVEKKCTIKYIIVLF